MKNLLLGLVVIVGTAATPDAPPGLPPLVPRAVFFANSERAHPQISPDGTRLAWLQSDDKGVLQIWTKPTLGKDEPRCETHDPKHGIRHYFWAYNGDLLFFQDHDGDENYSLFSVSHVDSRIRELTSVAGIRTGDTQLSRDAPNRMMVLRGRPRPRVRSLFGHPKAALFDPWILNLENGSLSQADENPGDAKAWIGDPRLVARGRIRAADDGKGTLEVRDSEQSPWRSVMTWGLQDSLDALGFTADGKRLYLFDNVGTDTLRLDLLDLANGKMKRLAADPSCDVSDLEATPASRIIRAVSFNRTRVRWKALNEAMASELAALAKVDSGDLALLGVDDADRMRLLLFDRDSGPARYYLWDRKSSSATPLWVSRPALEKIPLAPMRAVEIPARDGLSLPSYLTLPTGTPENLPLVLYVHGGPWTRDTWGYDGDVQWLTNRGYAVLQVNYRGSEGFGKKFKNAAMKQFARAMHTDLIDAVHWAVKSGIADPKRVAIMGDSFGGYATLVGMTFTPDVFACGVDMFGPSNLATLIQSFPAYWGPFLSTTWHAFVGDPKNPKDRADMESRSPLFKAGEIRAPLLIGQGANDPRVPHRESEQMVAAIEKAGGAVTYVVYADEGHGFVRPENRMDFFARTEAFLARCLGGRAEPLDGDKIPGSTPTVKVVERVAHAP